MMMQPFGEMGDDGMKWLNKYLKQYVYSNDLPFDARVLNMICLVGFFSILLSVVAHIIEHSNAIIMAVKATMILSIVLLVVISNRYRLHTQGKWVTVIVFCYILFPVIFLQNGGIHSGISAYFVMCMTIIFMLITGRSRVILLTIFLIIACACYYIDFHYPQCIYRLSFAQEYTDNIFAFIITGFFIGPVSVMFSKMYMEEKRKAAEAGRAKGDFLAQMSHEMRTPMNAIIGMSALSKSSSDLAEYRYRMQKIEEASNHLLGVINDILDMSKIEAGKLELSEEVFHFSDMLRTVLDINLFRIDEKQQVVTTDIDSRIPSALFGDGRRLAQVVANIVANAVKFTPQGGSIAIKAQLLKEEDGVCTIETAVTDTGIGITKEEQSRLFRSFEQANNSTSREYGGTGLGLAISKHITEAMGGKINVESEPGAGSTFTFTVRLKRVAASEENAENAKTAMGEQGDAKDVFRGYRALLAEDIEINREIALAFLEPTGLSIVTAENGQEAVRIFEDSPDAFDLIFMDIQMPCMDGYEATRRIRASGAPKAKTVPIIAMTANVFKDDVEKSIAAGMNAHLGKPLRFEEMISTIKRLL
jgi:signal transduction histidine kinase